MSSQIVFNYEDIQRQCQERLKEATRQAKTILEEAHQEAAGVRQQAEELGRGLGRTEGMNDAERQVAQRAEELAEKKSTQRIRTLLPALETAAKQVASNRERWLAEWEASAIQLAVAIAGRILRTELAADPELARSMISDALQTAAGSTRLRVRLHPEDVVLLGDRAEDVVKSLASCGEATILADETIERGGSVVETQHGVIDARLETQLDRILQELTQGS
jgi:flagellar assembly protein FliH